MEIGKLGTLSLGLVLFDNTRIDLLVRTSWNYCLNFINVFLSFQNEYKDENESFRNVFLYVGNF